MPEALGQPEQSGHPLVTGRVTYTVVPYFPDDDPRSELPQDHGGMPGKYLVAFALAVPGGGVLRESVDFDTFLAAGDSPLQVAAGIRELHVHVTDARGITHIAVVGVN
jgi:hypothetical protein